MSNTTKIEWTGATWNPITGCSVVSPGCTNCYAMRLAGGRLRNHPSRTGLTQPSKAGPVWTGEVRFNEQWLDQPLRWKKRPKRIFVCAHGDLFHPDVPDEWIDEIFAVMALCPQHKFQLLTKRPERQRHYLHFITNRDDLIAAAARPHLSASDVSFDDLFDDVMRRVRLPLPNVWVSTSAEDQERADERIPYVLNTPAAVRGVSCEPLLGPIDLTALPTPVAAEHQGGAWWRLDSLRGLLMTCLEGQTTWRPAGHHAKTVALDGQVLEVFRPDELPERQEPRLHWVIVGGESGPGARPMHPEWVRSIRDQCQAAGVPFFFKQWGEWVPVDHAPKTCRVTAEPGVLSTDGTWRQPQAIANPPEHVFMLRVGKEAAGRTLDDRTWDEYPDG